MCTSTSTRVVWKTYHMAHSKELTLLIAVIAELAYMSAATGHRGPSSQALQGKVGLCILMIAINISLRDTESLLAVLKTPWGAEPVPDHSTMWSHLDTIDEEWLQLILAKTAQMCMETAG